MEGGTKSTGGLGRQLNNARRGEARCGRAGTFHKVEFLQDRHSCEEAKCATERARATAASSVSHASTNQAQFCLASEIR